MSSAERPLIRTARPQTSSIAEGSPAAGQERASVAALDRLAPARLLTELGLSTANRWAWVVVTRDHVQLRRDLAFAMARIFEADGTITDQSHVVGPIAQRAWPDTLSSFEMDWVGLVVPDTPIASVIAPCLWVGELVVQGWWRRVRERDNPVALEARWHPGRVAEMALCWTSAATKQDDVDRAWKGLRILTGLTAIGGGRRKGSGQYATAAAFNAEVLPLIREARERGRGTSIEEVAQRLAPGSSHTDSGHRSVRGLRNQFRAAGYVSWAEVVAAAVDRGTE